MKWPADDNIVQCHSEKICIQAAQVSVKSALMNWVSENISLQFLEGSGDLSKMPWVMLFRVTA